MKIVSNSRQRGKQGLKWLLIEIDGLIDGRKKRKQKGVDEESQSIMVDKEEEDKE